MANPRLLSCDDMVAADVETVETGIGNPILLKPRLSLEEPTNVTRYPTLVRLLRGYRSLFF